ncbi:MAG: hypothetical protein M1833_003102 [Piccolia ochrophora]|nr:MAG: hypothetical protein M1833_003102 [Piccolia ochrophora]
MDEGIASDRQESVTHEESQRPLRVLIASTGHSDLSFVKRLLRRMEMIPHVVVATLLDCRLEELSDLQEYQRVRVILDTPCNIPGYYHNPDSCTEFYDMMVLAPISADTLSKMLHGNADTLLLGILRAWDVSKKVLLVPGMTESTWSNPTTQRQLEKLSRKWNWITVVNPPISFCYPTPTSSGIHSRETPLLRWNGYDDLVEAVKNRAELMTIGQDVDVVMGGASHITKLQSQNSVILPPELWTAVLDYLGDWEISQALGIYTNLPVPLDWQRPPATDDSSQFMRDLEWTVLTGSSQAFIKKLQSSTTPRWLSRLTVKLIIKFAKVDLLSYLEKNHFALFWSVFGHSLLPTKASAFFGKLPVLEWWRNSPSFSPKEYNHEAVDGASKAGFVHVLDWWHKSGLPLRYTEAALEQASARGHINVLDWWRVASTPHQSSTQHHIDETTSPIDSSHKPSIALAALTLLPGKSLLYAAQTCQSAALRWWVHSGLPTPHEESVVRHASSSGHVSVLETWKELKGSKLIVDPQALVGATKHGHADVLEWWRNSGYRMEYRICDIEEALEDCVGPAAVEKEVRSWWENNGLNLGVGTGEWMKVKVL